MTSFTQLLFITACVIMTSCSGASMKSQRHLYFREEMFEKLIVNETSPSNAVSSCYVSSSSSITPQSCSTGQTDMCLTVIAIATAPGGQKAKFEGLGCAAAAACSDAGKQALCAEVKAQIPYPVDSCTVTCCETNNCNKPPPPQFLELGKFLH